MLDIWFVKFPCEKHHSTICYNLQWLSLISSTFCSQTIEYNKSNFSRQTIRLTKTPSLSETLWCWGKKIIIKIIMSTHVHLNNVEICKFYYSNISIKDGYNKQYAEGRAIPTFWKKELLNLFQIKSRWSECESPNGNTKWKKKIEIGLDWKKLFSFTCTARFLQILWKTRPADSWCIIQSRANFVFTQWKKEK